MLIFQKSRINSARLPQRRTATLIAYSVGYGSVGCVGRGLNVLTSTIFKHGQNSFCPMPQEHFVGSTAIHSARHASPRSRVLAVLSLRVFGSIPMIQNSKSTNFRQNAPSQDIAATTLTQRQNLKATAGPQKSAWTRLGVSVSPIPPSPC